MPGRPSKTLADHVRDESFRPTRHHELLAGQKVRWIALARLQAEYRAATSDPERLAIAKRFAAAAPVTRRRSQARQRSLREELLRLGPDGSIEQLVGFYPRFYRHRGGAKAGKRFRLEPWQVEVFTEFWRRNKRGRRVYNFLLVGIGKGNGKTPWLSGLGVYALVSQPNWPEVYQIAGSKRQARIGHNFARAQVELGDLGRFVKPGRILTCEETNGIYEVLSSNGHLAQGVEPSGGIIDEWWHFKSQREREGVNALAQAWHKRDGWVAAGSTACDSTDAQLYETYDEALKHPKLEVLNDGCLLRLRDEDAGFLMYWWGAPSDADIEDPAIVGACNPASWVRPGDLLRTLKRPGQNELDWRRLHVNQHTTVAAAWLAPQAWRALEREVEIPAGAGIYVGVDAALNYDTTAVTIAWRDADGHGHIRSRVFTTREELIRQGRAHVLVEGEEIDNEAHVEPLIDDYNDRYGVIEVAYDRRFFSTEARHLADRFDVVRIDPWSHTWYDMIEQFYKAFKAGRVHHDGDIVLSRHMEAIAAHRGERGWQLSKLKAAAPIDAGVAGIMAFGLAFADEGAGDAGGFETYDVDEHGQVVLLEPDTDDDDAGGFE